MAIVFQPSPNPPFSTHLCSSAHNLNFLSPLISFPNLRHQHHQYNFRISSSSNNNHPPPPLPETECPVPADQQPINEYQSLSTSFPFSWASGDFIDYCSRLFFIGASFTRFVGIPVAWFGTPLSPDSEPLKRILGAVSSGIIVVTIAVVMMYLGWAYVGNRLLSATVEYEETGWYDGQIWVKPAEVLARDRLLGSFSVKPVLKRLKYTLITLGASLFVCALLLINLVGGQNDSYLTPTEPGGRAIPGVYNDDSAKKFEPDAFCSKPTSP